MRKAAVVIPNWNGKRYLKGCLRALQKQTCRDFVIRVVDNGSTDGSADFIAAHFPEVHLIRLPENTGFCHAVNEGILAGNEPFVILLNNDTVAETGFVGALIRAMEEKPDAFACQAKMLQMFDPGRIDDAGDLYCALGWAFARGRGRARSAYQNRSRIFSACGGACILRRSVLDRIGLFDERHFAYLEDLDIAWRAALHGRRCYLAPKALVWHAGSASSGSKHNTFKAKLAARNSILVIRKNMPVWQRLLNLPFLLTGFGIKSVYFARKGLGKAYLNGLMEGLTFSLEEQAGPKKEDPFRRAGGKGPEAKDAGRLRSLLDIQLQLWINTLRRIGEHV